MKLKKYTQEEFEALPLVDGIRQCPTGDYSEIKSFGECCSFGEKGRYVMSTAERCKSESV